ncbi:uncharacterized protein LOC119726306 [Patiria miniata]|uniref:Uncharacterized protein n=1 Tax=Patiria miniata TaxID=46514 RepID=A0A913ZR72_PATMI|nr:uncharacterized protein LOC119726306 [Patiria miniata]XP_038053885.1 uncharacterized protein LOC119726306 [Patiria miniata]XP_038053886.1 uncharacterized protein LOC119726306 [Patiria miniata]
MMLSSSRESLGRASLPELPFYSRKPARIKIPKSWQFLSHQQSRENWLDSHSIYAKKKNSNGLPRPGHRDLLTREATDIHLRKEQGYMREITGFPVIPHISGSANHRRGRPILRRQTANNISQEYRWVHNGLNGKMVLTSQRYRHILPPPLSNHQETDSHLHYCEVLGRRTCSQCVEEANRQMAAEYQQEAFPGLEVTAASLVAPKLSKTMMSSRDGPRKQVTAPESQISLNPFDTATTPPPYRISSAFTQDRYQISISKDKMLKSLTKTLRRDRTIMKETGGFGKVPQLQRIQSKPSSYLQTPVAKTAR